MKPANGFNKKQKEEIREIVRSEIREALRKNTKPDIKVRDEVIEAINSVLNEKNDDLISNLLEIENKISQEETDRSVFAGFIKLILRILCYILWLAFGIMVIYLIYSYFRFQYKYGYYILPSEDPGMLIVLFLLFVGIVISYFHFSINEMSKNDLYNSFMFIITMIAFIITVWTVIN